MNLSNLNEIEDREIINSKSDEVELSLLSPNPYQPRLKDKEIDELANSIKEYGQLQPIIINQDYIIVGGHRRYYACKSLGFLTIKVNQITTTTQELYSLSVIENEERENLTSIELALSYDYALRHDIYKTAKELGEALKKSESHITKVRSILKLPEEIVKDLQDNKREASPETLNLLRKIDNKEELLKLYYLYIKGQVNRQQIAQKVRILTKREKEFICISNNKLKVDFNTKHLNEDTLNKFEDELRELIEKYKEKKT